MVDISSYELAYPLQIDKLWQLKKLGMGLMAHCASMGCSHCTELDLDVLMEVFGPEHIFVYCPRISESIKCTQCGYTGALLTVRARHSESAS